MYEVYVTRNIDDKLQVKPVNTRTGVLKGVYRLYFIGRWQMALDYNMLLVYVFPYKNINDQTKLENQVTCRNYEDLILKQMLWNTDLSIDMIRTCCTQYKIISVQGKVTCDLTWLQVQEFLVNCLFCQHFNFKLM